MNNGDTGLDLTRPLTGAIFLLALFALVMFLLGEYLIAGVTFLSVTFAIYLRETWR